MILYKSTFSVVTSKIIVKRLHTCIMLNNGSKSNAVSAVAYSAG